jgi:hypothetical protein
MNTHKRIGSTAGGLCIGAVVMVIALGAGAQTASAGSGDAGATTPFLLSTQRGEVIPPDTEDVEHMCALLASCGDLPLPPNLVPEDFAKCVRKTADEMASPAAVNFSLTMRECGLRTNSCSELKKCVLRGVKSDACKGRGQTGAAGLCDADGRAITCFHDRVLAVRDCPRGGELCSVRDGQATCSLGACTPENKEGGAPTCSASGTRILRCEKGRLVSLDCATFGLRCTNGSEGAVCSTATAPCSGATKRCDGPNTVGCFNGHEVKVECSAAGLSCSIGPNTSATVGACTTPVPATGACDASAAAKCDGATIKYCLGGKPRSYFCKSLGFAKCVSDGKGARCTN